MKMHVKTRVLTLVATISLLGGTAFVASGSTGAYFSDTHPGNVGGSIGQILIAVPNTNLSFTNLMPGAPQTVTVNYTSGGTVNQDIWVTFPNSTALSALNNLGHYGSATVSSYGWGSPNGTDFTSANLDDNATTDACGPLSPSGCWPLPNQVKLASNVPPGQAGSFTFTFEYASALTPPASLSWNPFPLPGRNASYQTYAACETAGGTHSQCSNNQVTINGSDSPASGAGLPFQIVATQVGIQPNDLGSKF
jgi:hypothetical protein